MGALDLFPPGYSSKALEPQLSGDPFPTSMWASLGGGWEIVFVLGLSCFKAGYQKCLGHWDSQ